MAKDKNVTVATEPEPPVLIVIPEAGEPVRAPVKADVKFTPEQPRHRYWVGLDKDFTFYSSVSVGGITFNQITDPARISKDGQTTTRNQYLGAIETLSDDDVQRIVAKVVKKFLRGKHIVTLDNARMKPMPGDIPLARFLYMQRLPDDGYMPNRDVNGDCPEMMAQES